MARTGRTGPSECVVLLLWLVAAAGWAVVGGATRAQERGRVTDEQFIESLSGAPGAAPVDRKRLARLWFGVASTLDASQGAVGFLHGRLVLPETSAAALRRLLENRFAEYTGSVAGFKRSATAFLDQPESLLRWSQVLVDGQRTCWLLDVHQRLVETYGVSATDLMAVAPSREACTQLRIVAFKPRVESIVREALVEQVYQREEIRKLRQQVAELERLVEDLAPGDKTP